MPSRLPLALVALTVVLLSACGGGDDCAGLISINASAESCAAMAEELGCQSFEVNGPRCGLVACATCEGL